MTFKISTETLKIVTISTLSKYGVGYSTKSPGGLGPFCLLVTNNPVFGSVIMEGKNNDQVSNTLQHPLMEGKRKCYLKNIKCMDRTFKHFITNTRYMTCLKIMRKSIQAVRYNCTTGKS